MVERSHQKTELLKRYGDTVIRGEALEKELDKSKKHLRCSSPSLTVPSHSTITRYKKCR
jgi:hypothetical protein